ncbi:hypothetical protein RchiOBHm_Chr1g0332871 [Rosa chinensis]|uniref:Uncharacterized protein n=1 Tax=Rosa chinensis TaxID=74649 RepID=A0A2P6SBW7_ROSCH|nr:hypothetical protein RchiOBHm_Chr1g0332871 [Rosa chinensis]
MLSPWQSLSDPLPPSVTRLRFHVSLLSLIYPLPPRSAFPPFQSHGFDRFTASLSSPFSFGVSVPNQIGVATCKSSASLPLHELLLLSPLPNPRTSKTRLADRFEMPDEFGRLCALPNFIYNG